MLGFSNIIFVLVPLCSFANSERVKRQGFLDLTQIQRCRTPLGEIGVCLPMKRCTYLMDLLIKQRHRPEVINYLRSSVCGYNNLEPNVCCTEIGDPNTFVREQTTQPPRQTQSPPRQTTLPNINSQTTSQTTLQTTPQTFGKYEEENDILPPPGVCGFSSQYQIRVVGGTDAKLDAWPWIAALGYRSTKNPGYPVFLCGGSLITSRHVLTAAHCVYNRKTLYMVRLGDLNLFDDNDGATPIDIPIEERLIHKGYNPTTYVNDIAILRLKSPVQFSKSVSPVCLPVDPKFRAQDLVNRKPFLAGWGTIAYNGPSSPILQQLQVPVVPLSDCQRAFASFKTATIDDRVLCAGFLQGGKDACKGDSGGPLMDSEFRNKSAIFYQFGVVSYGYKCAEPGFPGVYTKVSSFADWIVDAIRKFP